MMHGQKNIKKIIVMFSFVEYFPEDGRKKPKHVGGLPHVCIYIILCNWVQLLEYIFICHTARNMEMFKFVKKYLSEPVTL